MEWWLNLALVGVEEYTAIARVAEEAGFTGVAAADHLLFPGRLESRYPYSADGSVHWQPETHWPDAWVAIAAMAAVTQRLRFTTSVYIAPLRDPFHLAKATGTLSAMSGGRLSCGFGTGWMREEFDVVGLDFADRGRRLDELIEVLRLLWSGEMVAYEGKHYRFPDVQMSPPAAGHLPVLIGGLAPVALRRAARNDGWVGVHRKIDDTRVMVDKLRQLRAQEPSERPFSVMVTGMGRGAADGLALDEVGVDALIIPLLALEGGAEPERRLDAIRRLSESIPRATA